MRPRHLAIVSVVVVALPVAACVGDDPSLVRDQEREREDAAPDVEKDAAQIDAPTGADAGSADADAEADAPATCPATGFTFDVAAFEAQINGSWKAPGARQGACSAAEMSQVEANFKDASIKTLGGYAAGVGATCRACLFSQPGDSRWGPLLIHPSGGVLGGYINWGACFALAFTPECGRALAYEQICADRACGTCSSADYSWCVQSGIAAGACAAQTNARIAVCPDLTGADALCGNTIVQHMKALCTSP